MSTIYITEQGALVKKAGHRLVVVRGDTVVAERHFRDISRVLLFGNVQMTTQAIHQCLHYGIQVAYFTMNGHYRGQLSPISSSNLYVKMAQISHWENKPFLLALARHLVAGKIRGQRYVLQKRRRGISLKSEFWRECDTQLRAMEDRAKTAESIGSLRGIEGTAARIYFSAWDQLLPKDFPFEKRSRRPALNGVNSALNFAYTLLLNEVNNVLELQGFDVVLGLYHSVRYGRISLSLDVMELFRPLFVDQWIILLARQRQIQNKDFYWSDTQGMYFTEDGRKKFLSLYDSWQKEFDLRGKLEHLSSGLEKTFLKGETHAFSTAIQELLSRLL
ncbi:CRISPR-associated endonuclease Cas1 [Geobacillus sp. YF-1]|uniref:CRISPR-associated endonuclease Cas1 n=1 Tax=Geobacillus sp. YF-1 TaxID=3457480 RepID=UPI004045E1EB